jgi:hypothetical protein
MILQITETISEADCSRLIDLYNQHKQFSAAKDGCGNPLVYWHRSVPGGEIITNLVKRAGRFVWDILPPIAPDLIYPETVLLTALGPGGFHIEHADNCRQNEKGEWVPNHTPQRCAAAIFYLNGDFKGGEICFRREGLSIKPRPGLLVMFPADGDHVHEVLPVHSGIRYTLPIWFTHQKAHAMANFPLDAGVPHVD